MLTITTVSLSDCMCILFLLGGVFYNSYFKLFDDIVQVFCPY